MKRVKQTVKRSILPFLALVLIPFFGIGQDAETPYRITTIVIDAGHGGKDPGNLGTGRYKTQEKHIALDVALRVGGYIEKQFPEINVIYTRKTDVFIGLDGRAEVANDAKADLFLSIHCNAFPNPKSNGVETFVLGLHRNKENLQVAMKENSAIFLEDDYKTKYEGFDPNSAESIIALTIMQSAYLQQSLHISSYIQDQFRNRVGRRDRGVKQAGFLVLRKTTMPSILIELGFLTHAPEEDFLNTENGKAYMSSAIFRGFKEYKDMVEDPLPEGYVEVGSVEGNTTNEQLQAAKQEQLDAKMKEAEKVKKDSIQKAVDQQAKIKAVADSLERRKEELARKAEEEQENKEEEVRKALIKAKIDSLEQVKKDKIADFEREQVELAAKKAKQDEVIAAEEEKELREIESKKEVKEWLEEIKDLKEQELGEAKRQVVVEEERRRLKEIKLQKQKELDEAKANQVAKEKAQSDSIVAAKLIAEQAKTNQLVKEQTAREQEIQDSLLVAEAVVAAQLAQQKARNDSISKIKGVTAKDTQEEMTMNVEKATSPEEAELLFLQLRKKQLEQRIVALKEQNVQTGTRKYLENSEPNKVEVSEPVKVVYAPVDSDLVLKVQVFTSPKKLSKSDPHLRGQDTWEYQQNGLYKYTVGSSIDFEEITKLQGELRDYGFKGAFVVAFKDGVRIKVSEARAIFNTYD
ncbi:N-acetylmuramoyl-L-alanine amidase [Flavobacteriales bacterium]|nr:N-acetylmuramoyl-L-alanine amidase [Flavobacteriales bacterium]